MLWAKAVLLAVVTFAVGLVISFASYFFTLPILAGAGVESSLADPGLASGLVGGAVYLAFIAVLALGLGTIIRSSAGGLAATLGLLLLAPGLLGLIPADWAQVAVRYLPGNAGQAFFSAPSPGGLDVWQSGLTMVLWVAVVLGIGGVLLRRRDA